MQQITQMYLSQCYDSGHKSKNKVNSYKHIDIVGKWVYHTPIETKQLPRREKSLCTVSAKLHPPCVVECRAAGQTVWPRCIRPVRAAPIRTPALRVKPYTVPARPLLLSAGHFYILM